MTTVFISYRRRGESAGYAGRLAAELRDHFGPDQLFRDIEKIEPGLDFVEVITNAVSSCTALIAVIGDDWLTATDAAGRRRLDDPQDFLHLEVATALGRNIRVIPVLVGDASMPRAEQLPEPLKTLARRQAHELSDSRWDYDIQQLIAALEKAGLRRRRSLEVPPPLLKRKPIKWALGIGLTIAVVAGVWIARKAGVGASLAPPAELLSFDAEPLAIAAGGAAMLRWHTANADVVKLDGNPVGPSDSTEIRPARTTTYRLSVRSAGHQIDTAVTVRVTASSSDAAARLPRIDEFQARPASVMPGQDASLCYAMTNAASARLDPGIGPLTALRQDCRSVSPAQTTTYTLTARGLGGRQVTRSVTVEVTGLPQPSIAYFEAQPAVVAPGNRASLCYGVFSAAAAKIDPDVGSVPTLEKECVPVTPARTTTYTLTVIGTLGATRSASTTVKVTAVRAAPTTYSTGALTIPRSRTADLDEGVVGGGADADIGFEAVTRSERYVVPINGAAIAKAGSRSVERDGCASTALLASRIPMDDLPVGTYVCVRTNRGRYSEFRINCCPSPDLLQIGYTTWAANQVRE
ncbi:MAG: toll/interleukin-1 receptor domain-containing protein [Gemmatimonadales bacterium]